MLCVHGVLPSVINILLYKQLSFVLLVRVTLRYVISIIYITMARIRLTKIFTFEMAHILEGYKGLCSNMHGHSYIMHVTISGEPNADASSPTYGMVMDFKDLKSIVNEEIVGRLDHSLMVRAGSEAAKRVEGLSERIVVVDYQPTCENMVTDFANRIMAKLPVNVQLCTVRLYETATSFAEWHAEDN